MIRMKTVGKSLAAIVAVATLWMVGTGTPPTAALFQLQPPTNVTVGAPLVPSDLTCTATSDGSLSDTQAKVDAAANGAVVCIPAGTFAWADDLTVPNTKGIVLKGAGSGTGTDTATDCTGGQTTYTCITGSQVMLTYTTGTSTANPRVTGITWYGTGCSNCSTYSAGLVTVYGTNPNFRFDNNRIDFNAGGGIVVKGYVRGVLDHNWYVTRTSTVIHSLVLSHAQWNGDTASEGGGDKSWFEDSTLGGSNNLFVETSTFVNTIGSMVYYTDAQEGARWVFRFNDVDCGSVQVHGTETSGRTRGNRYVEVYNNDFDVSCGGAGDVGSFRGGGGMLFDNVLTGSVVSGFFNMSTLRRNDTDWAGHGGQYPYGRCGVQSATLSRSGTTATATLSDNWIKIQANAGWLTISGAGAPFDGTFLVAGTSQTTVTYTVADSGPTSSSGSASSPFDGNTDSTGWPCMDQVGAGKVEVLLSGTGPACNCPAMSPNPVTQVVQQNNALEPVLCVHNLDDGAESNCFEGLDVILPNRDYFNYDAGCTGGGCSSGVGRGTTLPTACTPTAYGRGPYFMKTNEGSWRAGFSGTSGKFYECTASNTWTAMYGEDTDGEPYTYPHPLAN